MYCSKKNRKIFVPDILEHIKSKTGVDEKSNKTNISSITQSKRKIKEPEALNIRNVKAKSDFTIYNRNLLYLKSKTEKEGLKRQVKQI